MRKSVVGKVALITFLAGPKGGYMTGGVGI